MTEQPSTSAPPGNADLVIGASQQAPAASAVTLLEVRSVAKRFGPREVLKSLSLDIAAGEFLTLLGESGSGKTTLLRLIAGFEQPSGGEIWMSDERLDSLPPYKRRVNTAKRVGIGTAGGAAIGALAGGGKGAAIGGIAGAGAGVLYDSHQKNRGRN